MRTYRWLTLVAAIVITAFEAWLFTGSSAAAASQINAPTPVGMVITLPSGERP